MAEIRLDGFAPDDLQGLADEFQFLRPGFGAGCDSCAQPGLRTGDILVDHEEETVLPVRFETAHHPPEDRIYRIEDTLREDHRVVIAEGETLVDDLHVVSAIDLALFPRSPSAFP